MSNTNINKENISFLLEEKEDINTEEVNNKLDIFVDDINNDLSWINTFTISNEVGENEEIYEMYTVKELLKICCYYGLDKNIKAAKCRKPDIIATIEFFEAQQENVGQVYRRKKMWSYMTALAEDPNMKKYILWN
jgi:hypothetical protein